MGSLTTEATSLGRLPRRLSRHAVDAVGWPEIQHQAPMPAPLGVGARGRGAQNLRASAPLRENPGFAE